MEENQSLQVRIADSALRQAATEGMDAFVKVFADAIAEAAGGSLNAEAMQRLNADQITLWGYTLLHDELMDGGFVQLIHNGYGPFFFRNPFAKAMRLWGLHAFSKLLYEARALYDLHGSKIEQPCTDDEFMALFEQYPDFDELDDSFIEQEEEIQAAVAHYVDEHIDHFATII